jgi:hypothetical protein
VLVNPIENALKFSPASEPFRVQVTTTSAEVLIRVMANNSRVLAGSRSGQGATFVLALPAARAEARV